MLGAEDRAEIFRARPAAPGPAGRRRRRSRRCRRPAAAAAAAAAGDDSVVTRPYRTRCIAIGTAGGRQAEAGARMPAGAAQPVQDPRRLRGGPDHVPRDRHPCTSMCPVAVRVGPRRRFTEPVSWHKPVVSTVSRRMVGCKAACRMFYLPSVRPPLDARVARPVPTSAWCRHASYSGRDLHSSVSCRALTAVPDLWPLPIGAARRPATRTRWPRSPARSRSATGTWRPTCTPPRTVSRRLPRRDHRLGCSAGRAGSPI